MMIIFWVIWGIAILVGILLFIFWIFMIIDAAKRDNWKNENDKVIWLLVIILVGVLGAIIYYFAAKRPLDSAPKA